MRKLSLRVRKCFPKVSARLSESGLTPGQLPRLLALNLMLLWHSPLTASNCDFVLEQMYCESQRAVPTGWVGRPEYCNTSPHGTVSGTLHRQLCVLGRPYPILTAALTGPGRGASAPAGTC